MNESTLLEWLVAGALAGMVGALVGVWSLLLKRVARANATSESNRTARTTQFVDSPGAKILEDAAGAMVVQRDVHMHGYTGAVSLDEQHHGRLGVIGVLPDPCTLRIASAGRRGHAFAQYARGESTPLREGSQEFARSRAAGRRVEGRLSDRPVTADRCVRPRGCGSGGGRSGEIDHITGKSGSQSGYGLRSMSVKYRQHAKRTPRASSHANPGQKLVPPRPFTVSRSGISSGPFSSMRRSAVST